MKEQLRIFNKDLIAASVLLLLGIWIWWYSSRFPDLPEGHPGPGLFPRVIALGMAAIGLAIGLGHLLKKPNKQTGDPETEPADKSRVRLMLGLILVAVFPLLSPWIGFLPALLIIGVFIGFSLQVKWWKAILTAAVAVGFIYLIFSGLLNVPL